MDNTNWKTYRIGEIFSISTGSLLDTKTLKHGKTPRISAKSEGNGILGYFDTENLGEARHVENSITVNFFGADGGVFFHEGKVSLEMKVHSLSIFGRRLSKEEGLFLATAVKKSLHGFGYGNQLSSSKLRDGDFNINLPALPDGSPDYEFMADHVRRIQADHVRRIQAYLEATGLSDTVLTEEEEGALALKPNWREFNLGGLLTFKAIKQAKSQKNIPSDYTEDGISYIVQSISNNMVSRKVNKQWLINNNESPVSGNKIALGVTLPAVSYQSDEFGASQIITGEAGWLNKYTGTYIATVLSKMMYRFSYGSKPGLQIYKDMLIKLPSTPDDTPDFAFMETYIRANQKRVIKNLVEWNAKELAAYQSVI